MLGSNTLCTKSIAELKNHHFLIPDYQRGYRWEQQDVTNLLDDLWQFSQAQGGQPFYCLQPIVVRRRMPDAQSPAAWEVIDGQQRLTTIHIILTTLGITAPYTIEYQTRPDSAAFLNSMQQDKADTNIDFYHMFEGRRAVAQWRGRHTPQACAAITRMLQGADEPDARIIWYEVDARENAIAVFTRLNMGRIPLTDAELVKALFLRDSNFHNEAGRLEQQRMAQQWDEMERVLQADDFWFFLSNTEQKDNRIALILDLVARQWNNGAASAHDAHFTFLSFAQALERVAEPASGDDPCAPQQTCRREACWQAVRTCFLTMQEWYRDRTIFHLVGFMVAIPPRSKGKPAERKSLVSELWAEYRNCHSRTAFHTLLRDRTGFRLDGTILSIGKNAVAELTYDENHPDVVRVLLFFNIATLLNNTSANTRFQFNHYHQEHWDVEHISAMAEKESERVMQPPAEWLRYACRFLSAAGPGVEKEARDLRAEADTLLVQHEPDPQRLSTLVKAVTALYDEGGYGHDSKHRLGNLTLLDRSTNRSYKDSIFPIKRARILDLDATDTFVPPCTTNVFLKYYSPDTDNMMYWRETDRDDYQQAIIDTITAFLKNGKKDGAKS
ncbi:hypothetical protein Gxy13693_063_002 [Komagataeibacter xylinus NBRC 13693]|uniref:DUF262 domain-containing protein n=1 Tax=Komagataeibacter xylinus NBRC 13693 TaxID=1234668 RepID=A0A0D6QBA8_KOMXY|nr:DUF262 domain-containing protein [Komagataeibacter xylinus]GAO00788.1 hypothetical protein Gxy13693_063_002 [Komagataeibacter xylinus NBRC 13693]